MSFLVKNGVSNYEIVLPQGVKPAHKMAADELQNFLAQATGATLPVVDAASTNKAHIYLGVTPDGCEDKLEQLNDSGFGIKTVGENLYLYAKKPSAVCYAVYELLHRVIGWESYAPDEVYLENKSDVELPNFDFIDNPCIERRQIGFDTLSPKQEDWSAEKQRRIRRRFRSMHLTGKNEEGEYDDDEWWNGYFSQLFCHTTFFLVPPEKDENKNLIHPEWYNKEGNQLCWTNKEVEDKLIERLKQWILEWKDGKVFLIGIEDNSSWCQCEECQKVIDKYTIGGLHIQFINRIADRIEAWRKETMPSRPIQIAAFAYLRTKNPPVFKDENGKWQPLDETVRLRDNVTIFNAPIDACGYHSYDCDCNKDVRERFEKWAAIAKTTMVWDYHNYYDNFFLSMPNYFHYKSLINYYVQYKAQFYFAEGNGWSHVCGFEDMRAYVLSKLAWNCNLDQDELIDDFFKHYYKGAYAEMKEYFDTLNAHYADLEKYYATLGPRGYHVSYDVAGHPDAATHLHWPKEKLLQFKEILNRAMEKAKQEPDEEIRDKLEKRVLTEICMPDYWLIELYSYFDKEDEFNRKCKEFGKNCERCKLVRFTDWPGGKSIKSVLGRWSCRYPARNHAYEEEHSEVGK